MKNEMHLVIIKATAIICPFIIYHLLDDILDVIFMNYTLIVKSLTLIGLIVIYVLAKKYTKESSGDS